MAGLQSMKWLADYGEPKTGAGAGAGAIVAQGGLSKLLLTNWNALTLSQLKVFVKAMLRDYHGALSHLDMVRFLMPARVFYWQERGVVKRLMGGLPGAQDDLNSRVARNSLSCDSFKRRACLKFRLEDTNGASADAELAMKVAFSSQSTTKAQTSRSIFPLVHVVDCLGMLPVQFLDFTLT
ncbi:hypothetical protein MPTK2_2g19880 [Marchantia polymorpha subsp. ruderalis]